MSQLKGGLAIWGEAEADPNLAPGSLAIGDQKLDKFPGSDLG